MFFTPDNGRSGSAGGGGGSRAKTESINEEQEMADFLSSLDELTTSSNANTSSSSTNRAEGGFRGSGGVGNNSPGLGADLFFGSTTRGTRADAAFGAGSIGGTDSKVNTGRVAQEPPEWLKDFQALEIRGGNGHKRAVLVGRDYADSDDQRAPYGLAEQHEVLGVEPEILDGEEYYREVGNVRPTPAASAVLSAKSGTPQNPSSRGQMRGNHVDGPTADISRPDASADRTDYLPPRDSNTALPPANPIGLNNAQRERPQPAAGAAGEAIGERLDWPGTLDILGLEESDDQPQQRQQRNKLESSDVAAGLRVSERLPAIRPPSPRAETFPDFVEVRDPRLVSQWPKASASGFSKTPGGGGAGGGWPIDGGTAGKQQHAWPAPLRTVEMYLRPDVTWESVSDVYMAVMLSRGLVVREQTDKMVTAEKAADSSGDWATVTLRVGVTRDKLRTLVMQFYADTRAPILSLSGTLARFSGRAGDELYSAIRDALVEKRMPLSFLATDAREVSLDPHYVRDLVGMYAHENLVNLTRYALPLEEFVRDEEERSARLEATLLPKYNAHGLVPPHPTRSKQLSAYPLTTRRPPVSSCGVDEARAVVEQAREHARSFDDAGKSKREGAGVGDGMAEKEEEEGGWGGREGGVVSATAEGIRSLLRATWEVVKEWCDEEAEARVRRKDSQVRDRLLAVERHREALIAALRDGAGGAAALTTPSGREFAARFRPMAEEAVLAECKAVHGKRVGQLYLTFNHLCFYSSVLGFTSQKVVPLLTVASVSHASSSLGVDTLTVVDRGGISHSFAVTAVEPGFPERFHDLLQQVLVMCKADASRRAAKEAAAGGGLTGDPASLYDEPDEVQILARVQRLAKARQLRQAREQQQRQAVGNTAAPLTLNHFTPAAAFGTPVAVTKAFDRSDRPPPPPYKRTEGGEAADSGAGTPGAGDEKNVGVGGALGMGMEGGADIEVGVNSMGGGGGGGSGRTASMMAMGIQAFLEESQRKSC